jgi:lipopolysaccharide/colanic/teichoic acid biosynthesis glycosyltransferase
MAEKPVQMAVKRMLDIVISATALVTLAPLLLLIAALIRYDSKGPVLFTQARWGKNGKVIKVFKFRSMYTELCDQSGVTQTLANDPRVTRLGAVLRKTNIDELPQLLNVLRGDMSLVGPRCHAIGMLAVGQLYEDLVPEYHERHVVRPGLTGLAQMNGFRGPTDTEYKARTRVAHDLHYISNFSLLLDLRIMVGTLINEIRGGTGF